MNSYPIEEAAMVACQTVIETLEQQDVIKEVRFVLFSDSDLNVYRGLLKTCFTDRD